MKKPLELYSYIVSEESYPDGTVIIKENSYGKWMYILLEGRAKIKKKTLKGEVLIDHLDEGSVFGKVSLFDNTDTQRYASLVSDGPVTLGVLDTQKLERDWNALTPQMRSLISSLIKKRQDAIGTLVSMSVDLNTKIKKLRKKK
jgi:CRP-like cAMP-binding protein